MAWGIPKSVWGKFLTVQREIPCCLVRRIQFHLTHQTYQLSSISPSPKGFIPLVKYWFKSLTNLDGTASS